VIIELDGGQHGDEDAQGRDIRRDQWLGEQGFLVLRFPNRDVFEAMEMVKDTIFWRCFERLPPDHPVRREFRPG
jgi:very-short-patch-repair endonuclease